jgi:tetratricopeptide (TPR) repeat protein
MHESPPLAECEFGCENKVILRREILNCAVPFDNICGKANMKIILSILMLIFAQEDIYKAGKAQLQAKHYDEAEAEFRRLLRADATASKGYEGLALVEIARKNYDKAVENGKKAVELNAENAGAHYAMGLALFALKRYEETIAHCERFIELTPNAPETPQVKSVLSAAIRLLIGGEKPIPPGSIL